MRKINNFILILTITIFSMISFGKTAGAEQRHLEQIVVSYLPSHIKSEYYIENDLLAMNIHRFATKSSPAEDRLLIFPRDKSGGYIITTVDYRGIMTQVSINGHVSKCSESRNQNLCKQMLCITDTWRNKLRVKGIIEGAGRKILLDLRQFLPPGE